RDLASDRNDFYRQLDARISRIRLARGVDPASLDALRILCWEAVTNVDDHATRRPLLHGTPVLASLALRWYHFSEIRAAPPTGAAGWMQRTLGRGRGRVDTQSDVRGFVEISVLDDGVGIAARQSGDEAIYWKAMARERQYVLDALAERGSIKPKTQDTKTRGDVGYGFTHINSSLQRLGAWASLRTGRLLVT